jgi:gamma-glutamyl-gamma-aminobutyrate hydrolase PuuD
VIGVSASHATVSWHEWTAPATFVPQGYIDALIAAGAVPVVLPSMPGAAMAVLARLDGLVLTGGPDISPGLYGEDAHPMTVAASVERDAFEVELADAAIASDLPMLAVCRGLEVLNVSLGGTLVQHLPDQVKHSDHLAAAGRFVHHDVRVGDLEGFPCAGETLSVPSYHHQAVDRLAPELTACAWAADGTIEAAFHRTASWIVGVQWHPEAGDDPRLFEALVEASKARKTTAIEVPS